MPHVFQLRTKVKINNVIGPGFVFNVPSKWSSGHPTDQEIYKALESIAGKNVSSFAAWASHKYEVLA